MADPIEIITDPKEVKRILAEVYGKKKPDKKWKAGKRKGLGDLYVRSTWEANYCRWLKWLKLHGKIAGWEYEPQRFFFDKIRRGTNTYLPDFRVWITKCAYQWHEIKGWGEPRGMTAIKRFRKYFPEEAAKLVIIDKAAYNEIRRQVAGLIKWWEE